MRSARKGGGSCGPDPCSWGESRCPCRLQGLGAVPIASREDSEKLHRPPAKHHWRPQGQPSGLQGCCCPPSSFPPPSWWRSSASSPPHGLASHAIPRLALLGVRAVALLQRHLAGDHALDTFHKGSGNGLGVVLGTAVSAKMLLEVTHRLSPRHRQRGHVDTVYTVLPFYVLLRVRQPETVRPVPLLNPWPRGTLVADELAEVSLPSAGTREGSHAFIGAATTGNGGTSTGHFHFSPLFFLLKAKNSKRIKVVP
jgi:hypothetical protein